MKQAGCFLLFRTFAVLHVCDTVDALKKLDLHRAPSVCVCVCAGYSRHHIISHSSSSRYK